MTTLKHADFQVPDFREFAAGPQAVADYRQAVLALNPLAYWRFGESSGTTAADASGNEQHGAYLPGVVRGAAGLLDFDSDTGADFPGGAAAATDHATTPLDDGFLDGDWTISCIVRTDATTPRFDALGTETVITSNKGVCLLMLSGGNTHFYANAGGVNWKNPLFAALTVGPTYHLAATYDAATGLLKVYSNGAATASATLAGGFAAGKPFNIGEVYQSGASTATSRGRRWNGRIDEVAVFDAAISAADLLALYRLASGVLTAS